ARGAEFGLRFESRSGRSGRLEVASSDFVELLEGGRVRAKQSGYAALLARDAAGQVVDYTILHVHAIASLGVLGVTTDTLLKPGDRRALRAWPRDQTNTPLAGTLTYEWETSDPRVATASVNDGGAATLNAVGRGTVRVRVIAGGSTAAVDVLV